MAAALPAPVVPVQLPDFNVVTTSLRVVASELDHVSNMAIIHQADALAQMQRSMNELLTAMGVLTTNVRVLTTTVSNLDAKIKTTKDELNGNINNVKVELNRNIQNEGASIRQIIDDLDYNTQARIYNAAATRGMCPLRPLRNTTTHDVIDIPRTVEGLNELPKQEINALLLKLGQKLSSADRTEERLSQLRLFIGLHELA